MAEHEGLSVILLSISTVIAIITLIMFFIPFPWKFIVLIVAIILFISFILWYFYFYTKRHEGQDKASLEIRILPFYKGFPIPPSPAEKIVNADGSVTYRGRNDSRTTTEQVQSLAPSQLLAVWYGKLDEEKKEFIAKFGS
jgi:Ca2+/Na+ antiporter